MKNSIYKLLKPLSCTFVVLFTLSLPLFWGRFVCDAFLFKRIPVKRSSSFRERGLINISPSGLLPPEIENDPNVAWHSSIVGGTTYIMPQVMLGIFDYFWQRTSSDFMVSSQYYNKGLDSLVFDKNSGLIVYSFREAIRSKDGKNFLRMSEPNELFAGPDGVADKPSKELGRFFSPLTNRIEFPQSLFTYDSKTRRFFKIDFKEQKVFKGPELQKDTGIRPVQIGWQRKFPSGILSGCWLQEPQKSVEQDSNVPAETGIKNYEYIRIQSYPPAGPYMPFLDENGNIFLVDRLTLDIAKKAGRLPVPDTFFGSPNTVRPKDLLDFRFEFVSIKPDGQYRGMIVSSLSREGTSMAVAVFDKDGNLIKKENTGIDSLYYQGRFFPRGQGYGWMPSSKAIFWARPWSPFVTVIRYLLENLQGPALSMAAFFTADSFDAAAGDNALFFLPNSFIAMKARHFGESFGWKLSTGLFLILPSIILSTFLAGVVIRDAKKRGMTKNEKLSWTIAVFCLGIAGYISYRLCRPQVGLVTCLNCGKTRRVDMVTCHRCGSDWYVPELQDPGWQVADK
jgi:hypothetical protein